MCSCVSKRTPVALHTVYLAAAFASFFAQLSNAEDVIHGSDRQLIIELNQDIEPGLDSSVVVEMNGYDITALSRVADGRVEISLETPLAAGDHELSVLLFLPNGEIELIADKSLSITPSQSTSEFNATLNTTYRLDQKLEDSFADTKEFTGNGSLSWKDSQTSGKWRLEGEVEALYDSVAKSGGSGEAWSLPNLRAGATYQSDVYHAGVNVGQINMNKEDLLFSGYQRRGAVADITNSEAGLKLRAFALHSEPTTRYDGDLLWPKSIEKSSGITASTALSGQNFIVSVGYIDGETSLGGAGFNSLDETIVYGGDSWNIAFDSHLLENSVWVHVEYAESEFDSDGVGIGEKSKTDDAMQAMLQLSSDGSLDQGIFDYWRGYIQYQAVGADYYSLGNLAIPGDLETSRINWQAYIQGLSFDVDWVKQENNIDDNALLPTQTLVRSGISLNYTPTSIDLESGLWKALGSPSVAVNYYQTDNSQLADDAQIAGYDLASTNDEVGVTFTFSKDAWNWSLQHQWIRQDDKSQTVTQNDFILYQPPSDTVNQLTALQFGFYPSGRLSFNMFMQWSVQEELDFNNKYRNLNSGFDTQLEIIPDKLQLLMNYSYGQNRSSLSNNDFVEDNLKTHYGNVQLSWKAIKAKQSRPSVDFSLKSSYGRQDNKAFSQASEQWSISLGVEVHWAAEE